MTLHSRNSKKRKRNRSTNGRSISPIKMFSSNSTLSTPGFGNTKQIPTSKHWCFTLNNYTNEDIEEIEKVSSTIVQQYVFQEETGENGTEHLQGYIQFCKRVRPKNIFKNKRIHWERTRNIKASIEYCQKGETRTGKVFYRGIAPKYTIQIRNWQPWMYKILGVVDAEPDERKIDWIWEPNGNRGKTIFSKWLYLNRPNVLVLSGKAADMKHAIVSYLEKNKIHPRTILINVPRSKHEYISYTGLEEIKDMFFFSGKYEGGMVCGPNPHVIIMANAEPEYEKMSEDRWRVVNI